MDERVHPLTRGALAPDFTLSPSPRMRLSLDSLHAHSIVLVFYPFDWEPVTCEQLTLYQDYLIMITALGGSLIGISVDHVWSHQSFAGNIRLRFPLLADARPRGAVSRLYGVYREQDERTARALFILDSERVVQFSQVYPDELNPGVNDILSVLEDMGVPRVARSIEDFSRR